SSRRTSVSSPTSHRSPTQATPRKTLLSTPLSRRTCCCSSVETTYWVLSWEDKNSRDPGFDADFNDVVVTLQVQQVRCDNVTLPCPGIDDATSNHNVNRVDPALERSVELSALAVDASGTTRQGSPVPMGLTSCTGSSVDNLRFSYMQESIDYQTMVQPMMQPQVQMGAECGAALSGSSGGLPELKIHRYHRPRETAVWSSFGPGVFSNFDT